MCSITTAIRNGKERLTMFKFFSGLFVPNSPMLLECLKCGKRMHGGRDITRVPLAAGEFRYYVECRCGCVGQLAVSETAAAEVWNDMVRKDAGSYRRSAATIDDVKKWFKDTAETAKGKTILVIFKYNGSDMYEEAKTGVEARAIAIRLSKTYGRAQITNSTQAETLFINGEAVVDNGKLI